MDTVLSAADKAAKLAKIEAIKAKLNPKQLEIVTHKPQHMLVLAGAGSGKTRVLVHRVAYLIASGCAPSEIMAVTFTNKAANEMRSRLTTLLSASCGKLYLGTFHGLAHRFLRAHYALAQLSVNFQIIDQEDQKRLIKELHRQLNLDEDRYPHTRTLEFINKQKERGLRAKAALAVNHSLEYAQLLRVYEAYEARCSQENLVDFTELLLRTIELLSDHKELLESYQQQFKHLLIDEFQDTNLMQYQLIKLLSKNASVMAVGDDDQSIYSWRGAEVANMRRLQEDFYPLEIMRLEQNYRSSAKILSAANSVILHNTERFGKTLWTNSVGGEPVTVVHVDSDRDEAQMVVSEITRRLAQGESYQDFALLYRASSQSRVLEETLGRSGIPYRIFGSTRFYERAEIKDALSYLRLLVNPDDELALTRVINVPSRGIGEVSLKGLKSEALKLNLTLMDYLKKAVSENLVKPRLAAALKLFISTLEHLKELKTLSLAALIISIIKEVDLVAFYQNKDPDGASLREDNLKELVSGAKQFELDHALDGLDTTSLAQEYLASITLEADSVVSSDSANEAMVSLMTLHAAKGLEFPVVFMVGMEEGVFPNRKAALEREGGLEEERRLCYVGMTRAQQKLYLSYCNYRRAYHKEGEFSAKSRFLEELPQEEVEFKESLAAAVAAPQRFMGHYRKFEPRGSRFSAPSDTSSFKSPYTPPELGKATTFIKPKSSAASLIEAEGGFKLQQRVFHATFGYGTIVGFNGSGQVQVLFNQLAKNQLKTIAPSFLKGAN